MILRGQDGSGGGFRPSGSTPGRDARQIAAAFLQDWEDGEYAKAACYTDNPSAAQAGLAAHAGGLHLRNLSGSVETVSKVSTPLAPPPPGYSHPVAAAGARSVRRVTYTLNARVAASGSPAALPGTWTYHSSLTAYRQPGSSSWYIRWQPSVLAPNLTAARHLAAVTVPPQVISVTDSSGNALSSYDDPGLTATAGLLMQQAPAGKGETGLAVQIESADGKPVPGSQTLVVSPGVLPPIATTISAPAEQAARAAVSQKTGSAMVAIQPSTGRILAIANNAGYNNFALTARVAPGSDMKIITSTALIGNGRATADSPVQCPAAYTVQGVTIHNADGESEPPSTPLSYDFAQSCNDAFTPWWPELSASSPSGTNKLAAAAETYYGLNRQWDIGISGESARYFKVLLTASGSELAEEDFGEGRLLASPLAMASVAATVEHGSFKQPILVPGTKQITATPLPTGTDTQLKEMMRDVVTEGTAAGEGFGPDVYAKTGTADINGQDQPNAWFVAFDPGQDVAVADLVIDAGYGAQYAAPEVRTFFGRY